MRVRVENEPAKEAEDDEMVTVLGGHPLDERPCENKNGDNRQKGAEKVDEVIDCEWIDLPGDQAKKSIHSHDRPDLDGGAHLAVKLPESEVSVPHIAQLPGGKLKDLRILVAAEMTEIRVARDACDANRKAGIDQIEPVSEQGAQRGMLGSLQEGKRGD